MFFVKAFALFVLCGHSFATFRQSNVVRVHLDWGRFEVVRIWTSLAYPTLYGMLPYHPSITTERQNLIAHTIEVGTPPVQLLMTPVPMQLGAEAVYHAIDDLFRFRVNALSPRAAQLLAVVVHGAAADFHYRAALAALDNPVLQGYLENQLDSGLLFSRTQRQLLTDADAANVPGVLQVRAAVEEQRAYWGEIFFGIMEPRRRSSLWQGARVPSITYRDGNPYRR